MLVVVAVVEIVVVVPEDLVVVELEVKLLRMQTLEQDVLILEAVAVEPVELVVHVLVMAVQESS
tara:strand:+ start:72 stop:263 length:192 start_codon:yes stop_codon:yes gene_type:complete